MWSLGGLSGAGVATLLEYFVSGPAQGLIMAVALALVFVAGQRPLRRDPVSAAAGPGLMRALRPSRLALLIGAMAALSFAAEGAVLDWAAIFLRDQLGAPAERANLGYAAFAGAMALGRFCGDAIRRRIDTVNLLRVGCLLAVVGLAMGPLSGDPTIAVLGYALTGAGFSNVVPALFSAAGAMPRPEIQIAAVSTLGYAGLLVAPPLFGFVAHATSLGGIFYLAAAATVLVAVLAAACAPRAAETSSGVRS
jgi:fucose permease